MEQLEPILTVCDKEKLHEIGAIQRIGYLLAVKLTDGDLSVVALSENVAEAPWLTAIQDVRSIVGENLDLLLGDAAVATVLQLIRRFQVFSEEQHSTCGVSATASLAAPAVAVQPDAASARPGAAAAVPNLKYQAHGSRSFGALHMLSRGNPIGVVDDAQRVWPLCCSVVAANEGIFLLELENAQGHTERSIPNADVLMCGDIMGRVRAGTSILSTTAAFCDAVMDILPLYDRGMVYRFKDDLAGEVIYEHIRPNTITSSYAGLRFPSGDIPAPARKLFLLNGIRLIHDVNATDVQVIGAALPSGAQLDLSMSSLRAVSKVHIAYLRNMGVTASMSVAIVVNDALWGLYVFHSYSAPVSPTVEQRIMVEMVARMSSVRVDAFLREAYVQRKLNLVAALGALAEAPSVFAYLNEHAAALLSVLEVEAIVLCEGNLVSASYGNKGVLPNQWGLRELNRRCNAEHVLLLSSFASGLSGDGCGVAFLKAKRLQLVLVRTSHAADVAWGGCPDEAKVVGLNGLLEPRTSFALYVEKGRIVSKPWTDADGDIINTLFDAFKDYLHTEMLRSFELSLERSNNECLESQRTAQKNYEYFAHMSHELRTPFHGVMSSLQLLLDASDKLDTAACQEIVTGALDCGDQLLHTLNDILAVAKNKYHLTLNMEAFSPSAMLYDAYTVMKPFAMSKGLKISIQHERRGNGPGEEVGRRATLQVRSPSPVPLNTPISEAHVVGDVMLILQVLQNLLNNAIKFTPAGGQVIMDMHNAASYRDVCAWWHKCAADCDISYWEQPDGASPAAPDSWTTTQMDSAVWCCLKVEDTGPGINNEDDIKNMLKPFHQLSSGVSKTHQGTGLGLYICLSHVKKHGGTLGVASNPGKGTIFCFAVPLLPAHDDGSGGGSGSGDGGASPSGRSKQHMLRKAHDTLDGRNAFSTAQVKNPLVFIVDDSQLNVRLCERKLTLALGDGATFITASDGDQAVSKYEQIIAAGEQTVHAILMDYHMPRMSGKEAIMRMRAMEKERGLRPVPIAAYTADVSDISEATLLNAGASIVLPKPTPAGMMETVMQQLVASQVQVNFGTV